MSSKKQLAKVIEDDFNSKNNYVKIIKRIENERNYNNFLKYCFIPLVVIMILFIGYSYNYDMKLSGFNDRGNENNYHLKDHNNTETTHNKITMESKYPTDGKPSTSKDTLSYSTGKTCQKKKYYSKDITIYTYCIDSIKILDNIEFKDYLSNHDAKETIDNLINKLNKEATYKDGGSILYRESKPYKLSNEGISILKCNTIDGNKDIYIGTISMKYESDFCK